MHFVFKIIFACLAVIQIIGNLKGALIIYKRYLKKEVVFALLFSNAVVSFVLGVVTVVLWVLHFALHHDDDSARNVVCTSLLFSIHAPWIVSPAYDFAIAGIRLYVISTFKVCHLNKV